MAQQMTDLSIELFDQGRQESLYSDELAWLQSVNYEHVTCEAEICEKNIRRFEKLLSENAADAEVVVNGISWTLDDLARMASNNWFSDNIITYFASLINKGFQQHRTYMLYLNHVRNLKRIATNIWKLAGGSLAGVQIIFCLNVCNVGGTTFIDEICVEGKSHKANHFTMAVYISDTSEIIYADTLGWPFPMTFSSNINTILSYFRKRTPSKLQLAHNPQSFEVGQLGSSGNVMEMKHVCSENCSQYYPIQNCSSVCGVAVVICACVATLNRNMFRTLLNKKKNQNFFQLSYLRDISSYSHFLRLVIIDWVISGEIALEKLFAKSVSLGKRKSCHEEKLDSEKNELTLTKSVPGHKTKQFSTGQQVCEHKSNWNIKGSSRSKLKHHLDTSKIDHLLIGNPYLSQLKTQKLRLNARLKCGSLYSKIFPCSSRGKDDEKAIENVQRFLDSVECLEEMKTRNTKKDQSLNCLAPQSVVEKYLLGNPQISYVVTKNLFRVRCILKNGQSKSKQFRCSEARKNDVQAKQTADNFVSSPELEKWLLGGDELPSDPEWLPVAKISVGQDTTDFLEQLTFSCHRQFSVNHNVVSVEQGNVSTKPINSHYFNNIYKSKMNGTSKSQCAATIVMTCASKSLECHTKCGLKLSSINTISSHTDNFLCSSCGDLLEGKWVCSQCGCTNTQQWLTLEDKVVCRMCYQYNKRHEHYKVNPKLDLKRQGRKFRFHHQHLKCMWRMKLVLMTKDLSMWNVFVHVDNKMYHPRTEENNFYFLDNSLLEANLMANQTQITPNMLIVSKTETTPDKHTTMATNSQMTINLIPTSVDKDICMSTEHNRIHGLEQIVLSDNGIKLANITMDVDLIKTIARRECDDETEMDCSPMVIESEQPLHEAACGICIDIGREVFTCANKKELNDHIATAHIRKALTCNPCCVQGSVINFQSERAFKEHVKNHHNAI